MAATDYVHCEKRPRIPYTFLSQSLPLPPSISLPQILVDAHCPPLSLRDFYNYLRITERAQENLLFVLWFRDYERRFKALPREAQQRAIELDPTVTWNDYLKKKDEDTVLAYGEKRDYNVIELDWMTTASDLESRSVPLASSSAKLSPDAETLAISPWMMEELEDDENKKKMQAIVASADAELEKTVQLLLRDNLPFREEIARVVLRFLTPSSPFALSSPHIPALLLTLRRTTHPSSFRLLYDEIFDYLLLDAHPRFIRASLANAAVPFRDVLMFIIAGIDLILATTIILTCALLPGVHRGWRAFSIAPIWSASWIVLCLTNGLCPILFFLRKRHFQVWEVLREEYQPLPDHGEPGQGLGKNDWWSTHNHVRKLQWQMFLKAFMWSALTVAFWTAIIISIPNRT